MRAAGRDVAWIVGEPFARYRAGFRGLVLHHVYTERRLRPLDLYLREAGAERSRAAIVDYGEAIRDLARSNIFPGDMLLKNFPEEFLPFLGLDDDARETFLAQHRDLLAVRFWTGMQEQHRAGHVPDIFPYPASKRFAVRFG